MARDFYSILGVSKTASADDIKKAFRKAAQKHHPDVSKAPDAAAKFKELNDAYQVLSDPEQRTRYDRFGEAGVGGGAGGPGTGGSMAKLSTLAAETGLTGAEFTLAIPGNLGGAIWANAGAHGGEMSQILQRVVIMRPDGSEEELGPDALNLSYRHSRFKEAIGRGEVILGATLLLRRGEPAKIKAQLEEIRRWRREHQPLGIPSAGSVFKNPPEGPSAGALIEAAGLKGRALGGAEISAMHANWILNRAGATAAEIRELHDLCIREVQAQAGITLTSEIQFIGEEPA